MQIFTGLLSILVAVLAAGTLWAGDGLSVIVVANQNCNPPRGNPCP
jgi:hypothetical protein